jgi:hypothetical protein
MILILMMGLLGLVIGGEHVKDGVCSFTKLATVLDAAMGAGARRVNLKCKN